MALFDFDEMLIGTKKLATKIYNATGELFTSANPGLVKIENTTEESVPVQLSGRKGEIKFIDLTDTSEVAADAYADASTVVPANKKWTILEWKMSIIPPTGGESGSQRVIAIIGGASFIAFNIIMPFNKRFDYAYCQFIDAATASYLTPITLIPDDKTVHYNLLKGSILTSSRNLIFRYYNNTDVAQTTARNFNILVLEEDMTA